MANRRNFIKTAAIGSVAIALNSFKSKEEEVLFDEGKINKPIVIFIYSPNISDEISPWIEQS